MERRVGRVVPASGPAPATPPPAFEAGPGWEPPGPPPTTTGADPRPPDEVAGAYALVLLGGQQRQLRVLSIGENRVWKTTFEKAVADAVAGASTIKDLDDLVSALAGSIDAMLDLLVAYDTRGALGGREWLEANATDTEVYAAMKRVTGLAFPFGHDLAKLDEFKPILMAALMRASSRPMSGRLPNTAGRRRGSKPN